MAVHSGPHYGVVAQLALNLFGTGHRPIEPLVAWLMTEPIGEHQYELRT